MKHLAAALLLIAGFVPRALAQELQLPFGGRWFVMQGGDTINVNQHVTAPAQMFAIDFVKTGGPTQRAIAAGTPKRLEDVFSWGAAVLAPADATVVSAVNDLPDNPLGTKDAQHPFGNHVVLRVAGNRYVVLAHLQHGSVSVTAGDVLKRGQQLGLCGNSGFSDYPHVHLHVQDSPTLNEGRGQNAIFGPINVEMTGTQFPGVTWPLIRGLFVSNP